MTTCIHYVRHITYGAILALMLGALAAPQVSSAQTVDDLRSQVEQLQQLVSDLRAQVEQGSTDAATTTVQFGNETQQAARAVGDSMQSAACSLIATRDLSFGDSGEDVRDLQEFLNQDPLTRVAEQGAGAPGFETDFFGEATADALARFQEHYAGDKLAELGIASGTGYFGPVTREEIAERCESDASDEATGSAFDAATSGGDDLSTSTPVDTGTTTEVDGTSNIPDGVGGSVRGASISNLDAQVAAVLTAVEGVLHVLSAELE